MTTVEEALARAQSGYRSDVAELAKVLAEAELFAALAEDSELSESRQMLEAGAKLKLHEVVDATGGKWAAVFSSVEALGRTGDQYQWSSGGGPLRFLAANGAELIQSVLAPTLESGATSGIVFDAGQGSELAMTPEETLSMIRGEPIPLVGYSSQQPARGTEQVHIGEPAVPPSAALTTAIANVLDRVREVKSYRLIQVFVPERDVMSHLMLDVVGDLRASQQREISERIGAAVERLQLPAPGYLDVAFNFADS